MPQAYVYQYGNFQQFLASAVEIGLFTQNPMGNGVGIEFDNATNAPGYTRQPIYFTEVLNMCAQNVIRVNWAPTGKWPVASYFGIFLASTGELIYWGALPGSGFITGKAGSTPFISQGALLLDWTNPAMGQAANWGPWTGQDPIGPVDGMQLLNTMAWLTNIGSYPQLVSGSKKFLPFDQGAAFFLNVIATQTLGTFQIFNVVDATRGSTAGFTIAGPNALAF